MMSPKNREKVRKYRKAWLESISFFVKNPTKTNAKKVYAAYKKLDDMTDNIPGLDYIPCGFTIKPKDRLNCDGCSFSIDITTCMMQGDSYFGSKAAEGGFTLGELHLACVDFVATLKARKGRQHVV